MQSKHRVAVVGGGVGGMVAAIVLARAGAQVTLFERAAGLGGKLRTLRVGQERMDAGPTVLTLASVFEEVFELAGTSLQAEVALEAAPLLCRYAFADGSRFDHWADDARCRTAIAQLAGADQAAGYERYARWTRDLWRLLEPSMLRAPKPRSPVHLVPRNPLAAWQAVRALKPLRTMHQTLELYFRDSRLLQLFGRYATYCGASPYAAPAALNVVAAVEQAGVWLARGGMASLAEALERTCRRLGVRVRTRVHVTRAHLSRGSVSALELDDGQSWPTDAVVFNGDAQALARGMLGDALAEHAGIAPLPRSTRSLSAVTWNGLGRVEGLELSRHNVVFCRDYELEHTTLFRARQLPDDPTVYLCAQDRDATGDRVDVRAPERLFCLINAPACEQAGPVEPLRAEERVHAVLARAGVRLRWHEPPVVTTPRDFARLFPGTGGALYGQAAHGQRIPFARPGHETKVPNLFLAGGSVHPGAGLPMAARSGLVAGRAATAWLAQRGAA